MENTCKTGEYKTPVVRFRLGVPPSTGTYLVTDGEEVSVDSFQRVLNGRILLPSDTRGIADGVRLEWVKYKNVVAWAPLTIEPCHQSDDHTVSNIRRLLSLVDRPIDWKQIDGFIVDRNIGPSHVICSFVNCDGDNLANQNLIVEVMNSIGHLLNKIEAQEQELAQFRISKSSDNEEPAQK